MAKSDELLAALRAAHEKKTSNHPAYRDPTEGIHIILDKLVEEGLFVDKKGMREDIISMVRDHLTYTADGSFLHREDGDTAEAVLRNYVNQRPFLQPSKVPTDLVTAACIGVDGRPPTLAARAALRASVGHDEYLQILAVHGCRETDLRPGIAPEVKDGKIVEPDKLGPKARERLANPFTWTDKAKREAEVARLIKAIGTKAVAGMAKAAGMGLDFKPLRKAG